MRIVITTRVKCSFCNKEFQKMYMEKDYENIGNPFCSVKCEKDFMEEYG